MCCRRCLIGFLLCGLLGGTGRAAPVIGPIPTVTIPAGKSLAVPITATSPSGQPLTYTITSNTNRIGVVMHTNNPFWQLTVAQAAPTNAPGAYKTPFRGGLVSVTNVGEMTFLLFPEYAPRAINAFQGFTTAGYFNSNTIFHRVATNFVIQGGDPLTNGSGGPVFEFDDEFNPQAVFTGNGQLALANHGKDTCGSQFFITVGPQRTLDFRYTLFGQLVRGFDVLTNINHTAVNTTNSRPLADEIIQLARYVTNSTDTVVTLTATNVAGITGTITVIADAGPGGRTTNTFTAKTVNDTNSSGNPILFPGGAVTNLVGPVNKILTNFINAVALEGQQLYWFPEWFPGNSLSGFSGNYSNTVFRTLTYNVTNKNGTLKFFLQPASNYVGAVDVYFDVGNDPNFLFQYDEQLVTFIFGDTPIVGQSNAPTVLAASAFANVLVATFTNGVPGSAPANFLAAINWGDNVVSGGRISTNSLGQKTILGAHTYNWPGLYPVYVTVQSSIGAKTTILSWVKAIANAPRLTFGAPPVLGPNGFSFNLEMAANLAGSIQFSTNLSDWTTLTNFSGTNATLTFRDSGVTNSSRRFYRAVIP